MLDVGPYSICRRRRIAPWSRSCVPSPTTLRQQPAGPRRTWATRTSRMKRCRSHSAPCAIRRSASIEFGAAAAVRAELNAKGGFADYVPLATLPAHSVTVIALTSNDERRRPGDPGISLCLVFHNHQPVGNFGWVFRDLWEHAYEPLWAPGGAHRLPCRAALLRAVARLDGAEEPGSIEPDPRARGARAGRGPGRRPDRADPHLAALRPIARRSWSGWRIGWRSSSGDGRPVRG